MRTNLRLVTNDERIDQASPPAIASRLLPFVMRPLHALRYLAYLVLLFVRIPLRTVQHLATVPLLLAAVVWGWIGGWTEAAPLALVGGAFALFLLAFLFDTLLLVVAPEQISLDT